MKNQEYSCVQIARRVVVCFALVASVFAFLGPGMAQESGTDIGGGLYLGSAVSVENLTVWPVYSKKPMPKIQGEFITLAQAQKKGKASVREVGARAAQSNVSNRDVQGVVGELVVENRGKKPILVLAGTLLKGGKQDRQVGQDFVVPPKKTVPVEAFCVEHGRWTANRDGEQTHGFFKAKKALATKSVRKSAQYEANQSKVWENVAEENKKAGKAPSSGTLMAAVEETGKKSKERRMRFLKATLKEFKRLEGDAKAPVGLAYAVDGKVKEVRSFTHPRIFNRFKETLLNTVAMEADLAQSQAEAEKRPIYKKKADAKEVAKLVKGALKVKAVAKKNKAGNVNRVRKSDDLLAGECFEDEKAPEPVTSSYMYAE